MKKIVYIFLAAATIIFISGRIQSSQNVLSENNTKHAVLNETKADAILRTPESKPKILFMVNEKNAESNVDPALWWSFKQENKDGC